VSFADLIAKKSGSGSDEESYPEAGLPQRSGSLEAFIQKFGHVTEEYKFYDGEITLRFNVDEHRYYRVEALGNLTPLNGVTNTVGIIDKSHMLTPWAAKMAIQKLLRIMPTEMVEGIIRIKPLTFEEFTVIALEAKGAHKEKLDEAGDIGHMAHKCLEDSINFAMQHDPQKIVRQLINIPTDELAANAASSGFNWMSKHNVRWQETESKIYSREHEYAGTMDGLALCDSCEDRACCPEVFKDRLSLIDWKSSNHLKIEYLFQTASYKHAKMEEYPDLKILDTWILRLGKSDEEAGKFEPWHMTPDEYEEDFQGFLACLRLTRLVDSVEERMKKQKGTIRAVKKEQRETAKALAKEQEKLKKAFDKAAAKVAKDAEKARIKEEAKVRREELKAAKKAGIKPGSVRYKPSDSKEWVITQPGAPLFSVAQFAATEVLLETGWEPIEGRDAQGGSAADCKPAAPSEPEGSIPSSPTTDLPEGIQPNADEAFIGGAPCTSTSKKETATQTSSTPLVSTCPTEPSTQSQPIPPETEQFSASTSSTAGTKQPELTAESSQTPSSKPYGIQMETEYEYVPTFSLPME
jgi:hypothetical protein